MSVASYAGRRMALLTQHGKDRVIAPVLEPALGCKVERVMGYDTDALGTFTREIARAGTQLEAARRKARIGMELSGLSIGLASEGSFGPDPVAGMLPWNVEIVLCIDDAAELEIVGKAQGPANHAHGLASDWAQAERFARGAGFPEHHLVLRPDDENDPRLRKGIKTWDELAAAYAAARAQSTRGLVFLENDLRAHANPTRMQTIRAAAEDLLARLRSACPACGAAGFWIIERVPGLPCADCGEPTRQIWADIFGCLKCAHRQTRRRAGRETADPARCDACNP